MCTADGACYQHTAHHGKAPGEGYYNPPAVLSFTFVEGYTGANAVAHEYHDHGSHKFEDELLQYNAVHCLFVLGLI